MFIVGSLFALMAAADFLLLLRVCWDNGWNTEYIQEFLQTWKLEKSSWNFVQHSGKNCNKQNSFVSSFEYLCKTAVHKQDHYDLRE